MVVGAHTDNATGELASVGELVCLGASDAQGTGSGHKIHDGGQGVEFIEHDSI
jgi:hypothetical protein